MTFQSLDVSLFWYIPHVAREYGSSSHMNVIGSRRSFKLEHTLVGSVVLWWQQLVVTLMFTSALKVDSVWRRIDIKYRTKQRRCISLRRRVWPQQRNGRYLLKIFVCYGITYICATRKRLNKCSTN